MARPQIARRRRVALRRAAADGRPSEPASVREVCALPASTPLLVHAGGIAADRALGAIVDALPRLPACHLALVHTDRERAEVRDLVRRAGPAAARVHEVPRPRRLTPAFLAPADLAVYGFEAVADDRPLVPAVLDAYREAGLPVVAGEARAVREHLAGRGPAEFFAPGSVTSFVAAVERARERVPEAPETAQVPPVEAGAPGSWRPLGTGPVRLGLGTANYAGQLSALATAISAARPDVGVELVVAKPPASYRYPADRYLHFPAEHHLDVQLDQARRVLAGYTHLIVDAFRPVLGRLNGDDIAADLPALRRAGIKVALLAHGSEIRHPGAHLRRHAESAFRDAPEELRDRLTAVAERNRRTAEESGLPLFVTTPDLLADVPFATWAPLVIDVDAWAGDRPVLERSRPVVLHAPTSRWTKGTDRLLPRLRELHDRRIIELRLVEGLPYDEMVHLVRDADIVVDQLVMGTYGTFSCEGMAAGKVVVAYLDESVHHAVGVRPPIASATPTTIGNTIESLLDDRHAATVLAAAGPRYVREHHDGRHTAAAFDVFLR
ncbi:glycosyl transferase family 1 [Micromonospora narathiwatensis]|uniref:glycosyl transferase family 1 n=1 Tax=Micromonospora narathiwatensis TaxID=299146 RepID=UPI0014302303|nr:glycosyl transferase family 1 [Micromonospora narathiwatensis]